MKKERIIIVGGGIVGATAAYYLSKDSTIELHLIDWGQGNATRAAAGIICPWLSQRRNKDWYRLTAQGAAFYQDLMKDLEEDQVTNLPYKQTGTLVFKKNEKLLDKLEKIGRERRQDAPRIGQLTQYRDPNKLQELIPSLASDFPALLATGGGRLDGGLLVDILLEKAEENGCTIHQGRAKFLSSTKLDLEGQEFTADKIILTVGAWLPQVLSPLGFEVDVRPQKGQLIECQTDQESKDWPGCMLIGEIDILPFDDGKILVGASHEDDQGFDLSPDFDLLEKMKEKAQDYLPFLNQEEISTYRIGTRAYTSDYLPFYGTIEQEPHILVASGLGSSGLTSGPFIGWQLAQTCLNLDNHFDASPFQPAPYIKKRMKDL